MSTPNSPSSILLNAVLAVMRPLVRLLVRQGVTYTVLIAALKRLFLDAAHAELKAAGKPATDSAVSLLSGVHRRDVRNLTRLAQSAPQPARKPVSAASQVIGLWMSDPRFLDSRENPAKLARSGGDASFDALAASVSNDVRPRALLDELMRLGVVRESDDTVELLTEGFVPRAGYAEITQQFRDNLADHVAAASANLHNDQGFLEQAIFVDEISQASAHKLHKLAAQLWRQGFKTMMREAQARVEYDAKNTPASERTHRARYGSYFYSSDDE
jgi:hypothetical protein